MALIQFPHLPLLALLCLLGLPIAIAADRGLGDAVKAIDAAYLNAPASAAADDDSVRIVAGGGEDGLPPLDEEISLGPMRVTLTYVAEPADPDKKPPSDALPGDAPPGDALRGHEAAAAAPGAQNVAETPQYDEIPPDAMLPGEAEINETIWRAPVVTIYVTESEADAPTAGQGDAMQTQDPATSSSRAVATLQGPSAGMSNPPVGVQIGELDAGNPYPEVVVSFFTGGAHCCSLTRVITSTTDGSEWKTVGVGEFDGGPMLGADLDGDGLLEFETRDNAFLTAFACYACSQAPLRVLALRDGAIKDVGADKRFRPAHAAWLREMIVGVPEDDVNGFLAGYVAQKMRLGEGSRAWDLMLEHYDRDSSWGLETCETDRDATGACPGATTKVTYPAALKQLLEKTGYSLGG